jgi:hypothetical protein
LVAVPEGTESAVHVGDSDIETVARSESDGAADAVLDREGMDAVAEAERELDGLDHEEVPDDDALRLREGLVEEELSVVGLPKEEDDLEMVVEMEFELDPETEMDLELLVLLDALSRADADASTEGEGREAVPVSVDEEEKVAQNDAKEKDAVVDGEELGLVTETVERGLRDVRLELLAEAVTQELAVEDKLVEVVIDAALDAVDDTEPESELVTVCVPDEDWEGVELRVTKEVEVVDAVVDAVIDSKPVTVTVAVVDELMDATEPEAHAVELCELVPVTENVTEEDGDLDMVLVTHAETEGVEEGESVGESVAVTVAVDEADIETVLVTTQISGEDDVDAEFVTDQEIEDAELLVALELGETEKVGEEVGEEDAVVHAERELHAVAVVELEDE